VIVLLDNKTEENASIASNCVAGLVAVYHWTFVWHQLSKTCSRHIFSHIPTSLTVSESTRSEHCIVVTPAILLRLMNCRIIIIIIIIGWRHGSVVRILVFGWWTFPDLCLIYGWHAPYKLSFYYYYYYYYYYL